MRITATTLLLLAAEGVLPACDRPVPGPTAQDQGSGVDARITAAIRRAILADGAMSPDARNCKIITAGGAVTVRGPVLTAEEKRAVEAKARGVAGVVSVTNELEVRAG